MPEITLTTMVMIIDRRNNRVLVQDRVKSWKGISFPGGKVEKGESIIKAAIREVKEETGLSVKDLKTCGIIHWYNDQTGDRYIVFNYKTESWEGELEQNIDEGRVFWTDIEGLNKLKLAGSFEERLCMFLEDKYSEGFATWNDKSNSEMKFF